MATSGKRKGTSVQTYRFSSRLAIRLEYDHADQRQSVFLNGELRSSFHCPVGFRAEHTFRGQDAMSEERGHLGEWSITFAVEQNSYRIRYVLLRRNAAGDDTKWYWWDRNLELDDETRFPEYGEGEQIEVQCESCGTCLRCPECNPPESVECEQCEKCGTELACPKCDPPKEPYTCSECGGLLSCETCEETCEERVPRLVHDVARMQEETRQIDANLLQNVLIDAIGSQVESSTSWAMVMEQVLTECGCDISAVRLILDTAGEESE